MEQVVWELNFSFVVENGCERDFLTVIESTALPFCRESEDVLCASLKRVEAEGLDDSEGRTFCLQVGFATRQKMEEWREEFAAIVAAKFRRAFARSVLMYPSALETLYRI